MNTSTNGFPVSSVLCPPNRMNFWKRLENTLESSSSTTSNSFLGGMIPNQPYSKAIKLLSNQKILNKETKQICKHPKNKVGLNFFALPTLKKFIETPHLVDFVSVWHRLSRQRYGLATSSVYKKPLC